MLELYCVLALWLSSLLPPSEQYYAMYRWRDGWMVESQVRLDVVPMVLTWPADLVEWAEMYGVELPE